MLFVVAEMVMDFPRMLEQKIGFVDLVLSVQVSTGKGCPHAVLSEEAAASVGTAAAREAAASRVTALFVLCKLVEAPHNLAIFHPVDASVGSDLSLGDNNSDGCLNHKGESNEE